MLKKKKQEETSYSDRDLPVGVERIRIVRGDDGQFSAQWDGHTALVRVNRCFPWSRPDEYVSLRDIDDREVALVHDTNQLDPGSREALAQALAEESFVFEVTRIDSIAEEFEIRNWRVQTRQGSRTFQTRRDAWPLKVGRGGYIVRDVCGDLFHIDDPKQLDAASRKRLAAYID